MFDLFYFHIVNVMIH
uniref:Uncharacterized protein n=1 Tax=Arundo donax TaxID=35708 RepID=A0A0A8ZXX6_ARUDO